MNPIACELIQPSVVQRLVSAARESYSQWLGSRVSWVNWRKDSCQIAITYDDVVTFRVFVDFKFKDSSRGVPFAQRDAVLKALHGRYAGENPHVNLNGEVSHSFLAKSEHISVQKILGLAQAMCGEDVDFSVLYIQSCVGSRPFFEMLGRALVPGECGLVWSNGMLSGYSDTDGAFV